MTNDLSSTHADHTTSDPGMSAAVAEAKTGAFPVLPGVEDFAVKIASFTNMTPADEELPRTPAELEGALVRHKMWVDSLADPSLPVDGRRLSLRGGDLRGVNLARRDLRGADLAGTNLEGAVLHDALLTHADLSGACLRHADLRHAQLRRATLTGAILDGAALEGANFTEAQLTGTLLQPKNSP